MQPEPAEVQLSEAEFLEYARANLRRNYTAHLLHGLFGQTGFRLLNAPTFIPAYVFLLSGSEMFVGLARSAQALGQSLQFPAKVFLTPSNSARTKECYQHHDRQPENECQGQY